MARLNSPRHPPDEKAKSNTLRLSQPFARSSMRGGIGATFWAGIALTIPLITDRLVDIASEHFVPQWGRWIVGKNLATRKKEINDSAARECAFFLGKAANQMGALLKEVEQHSPRYEGRVHQRHEELKRLTVRTAKKYFPQSLPRPVEFYTNDAAFESFVTGTLPELFAPHKIAVHPHTYEINCEGAPSSFKFTFEIAEIRQYGKQGFELWGKKVKRDVVVLGENYSQIEGSEHQYAIGDWLGLYSGQVFINEGNI